MAQTRPKVVIVGAGFGGLQAAKALAGAAVDVTVLDRENHHCFQPLLYQVATAALSPADVAWPIRHILRKQANVTVLMAEVRAVDTVKHVVHADSISIPYDYLVLATGATHSYFGHDEWAAVAPGLKRIEDATRIRRHILIAFERAELATDAAERARLLTFAIVGGGATGVEMAGAISEVARQSLAKDFRHIDPTAARIVLIEAGPRVMPTFPENLSGYVARTLAKKGVEVMTSTFVTGCDARGVAFEHGRLDAGTIIWAAGVVASPAARWLDAAHDRAGRVLVKGDLSVPGHPEVFVIGDTASVVDQPGIPGTAPPAKQMGAYVGKLIGAKAAGRSPPPPFRYRHLGDLATVGRHAAVVKLGWLELTGFLGWLFWSVIHIYFLIGVRDRFIVAFTWLWDYVTFQRGARLITQVPPAGKQ
ncbi:MAG TPA: NAD(P)/FAD-dependent oxidoreductase [Xanthobacteraceae bacterium]|jgi:NADH dehydrogenase